MQFLIETDVLREYLIAKQGEQALLRKALSRGVCYTTMYNALELFRASRTKEENDAIMQVLMSVRVLGFNSRFAQNFADMAKEVEKKGIILSQREAMIVGMAKASKLTILTTDFFDRYKAIGTVPVARSTEEVPK